MEREGQIRIDEHEIKERTEMLISKFSTDVGLDYAIRALENFIDETRKNGDNNDTTGLPFRIIKIPTDVLNDNTSYLLVSKNIATIHYPKSTDDLTKRVLIARELGHLYLHYDENNPNSLVLTEKKEEEANLFAKSLLSGRCKWYESDTFKTSYQITEDELNTFMDSLKKDGVKM